MPVRATKTAEAADMKGTGRLAGLWGRSVIVSGRAVFRPSGTVLRIEADRIEEAVGDVSAWAEEPRPLGGDVDLSQIRRLQGPRSGINAIIGRWR